MSTAIEKTFISDNPIAHRKDLVVMAQSLTGLLMEEVRNVEGKTLAQNQQLQSLIQRQLESFALEIQTASAGPRRRIDQQIRELDDGMDSLLDGKLTVAGDTSGKSAIVSGLVNRKMFADIISVSHSTHGEAV